MCVIEQKIHRHSDGRRSRKEKVRYCHEGKRRGSLCDHVEHQDTGSAAVSETMASSSSRPSSTADIITTGRDGKERQYFRVSTSKTKRSSLEASQASPRYSSDALLESSSLSTREVRPSTSTGDRRHRRSTKYSCSATPRQDGHAVLDGAAYERPPSLEMLEGDDNNMRPARTTSVSPPQTSAQRKARPKAIIVDNGGSMTGTTSSLGRMSPGLSNLPRLNRVMQDPADDMSSRASRSKYQARVDSLADEDEFEYRSPPDEILDEYERQAGSDQLDASERYQAERISREIDAQEDEQARLERGRLAESDRRQVERDQARIVREQLAESDRRQTERNAKAWDAEQERRAVERQAESDRRQRARQSQQATLQARARAEEVRRERHRQDAAAALERSEAEADYQRRVAADHAQVARERAVADAQKYAASQYYEPRSVPPPPIQITYTTVPASSPISARQMTNAYLTNPSTMTSRPTTSARQPAVIHNNHPPPISRRDSIREHGDAVIAREQQAARERRSRRLSTSMRGLGLQDRELDAVIDASMRRQQPADGYERERVTRYERQQQYYQS